MSASDGLTTCSECGQKFPSTVRLCPNDGTVLEHAATTSTQAGQVLDGKYRLDALLAEGGMGAVYRATHVMLGKKIAIKLIRSELGASPEIVRRFQREARAATALNHPNIVSVYDLGQTPNGTLYIAMEFIEGPSLRAQIQAGHGIAPFRTVAILRQVSSALSTAHKHNIIHRDLKPQNIMLTTGPDGSEQAKLVDFGIAKTFDEATQLTSLGSALGTPYYMSPEQIEGRPVDARSDLYALGIILYEMLVGEVPFSDQSTPAVLVKQLKERPPRPSLKNPAVPAALETIALRCLEKDPGQRFQSADEFAAALNDAAATLTDTSGTETMPMASIPARAATPPAGASAPTLVSSPGPVEAAGAAPPVQSAPASGTRPVAAQPAMAALSTPQAAGVQTPGTKPTVPVPPEAQAAASPGTVESAQRKPSSIVPLMAVAALLLFIAGGYLVWSQRQSPAPATPSQADAPKATPAMAPQEPVAQASNAPSPSSPSAQAPAPPGPPPPPPPPDPTAAPPPAAATNHSAGSATATKEALAARMPPTSAAPRESVKSATVPPANAGRVTPGPSASSPSAAASREPAAQRASAPPPTIPENAAVIFRCSGAPEVCASLRTHVNDALDKAGYRVVTTPDRADIAVGAVAGGMDEKASHDFGQTFVTRTYQIELHGEAPRLGDIVSMPPATTVTFDATVGRERLEEKSRLVASDIVDRVRAYIKKKHGN
jgi:serine/threonine-protein kinase